MLLTGSVSTLVDLAGIAPTDITTDYDGRSLLPALSGQTLKGPVFAEHIDGGTSAPWSCIRDKNMKLILSRAYPAQLYDLSSDPDELHNLAG